MKTKSYMIVTAISATFVLLTGIGDEAVARGGGGGGGFSRGGGGSGGGFSRGGGGAGAGGFPAVALLQVAVSRQARDDPAR